MGRSISAGSQKPVVSLQEETAGIFTWRHPRSQTQPATIWLTKEMRVVWCFLLLYSIGFLVFYPRASTNFDELSYVRQAAAFAAGHTAVDTVNPFTGSHQQVFPYDYPPGTAAFMTPFVWLGGWRGAFLLGLVSVLACVLFTAKWIVDSGGSPLWALVILGFAPTLVMARTAMSDVPSACLVAAGLWLFWPQDAAAWRRLLAGFIAGASLCLREPNPILFAVFFAGALLRRERNLLPLIAGGIAGVACRPLGALLAYGNPWFIKYQPYGFGVRHVPENLVMYLTALLVLVPIGLILGLAYRGFRWPELTSTVTLFVGMFIFYNYNGASSGGLRQWLLSLRFMIPLLPILAFAMAHTGPRWYAAFLRWRPRENRLAWMKFTRAAVVIWLCGVAVAGLLANWRSERYSAVYQDAVAALYANTSATQPIVADIPATAKFLNELYGPRMVAELNGISRAEIGTLAVRHKIVQIVFFDRDDSDYWLDKSAQHGKFMDDVSGQFATTLKLERRFPGLGVLRIWIVSGRS
jgi:hypothetical protein